jgi:predicted dienelactone hydrolase
MMAVPEVCRRGRRRLAGLRAIVTGGSSGVGRALALELARSGARVLATARRRERLDELARRVQSGDPVVGRADLSRIGMSGHSFGAITTQALAGERFGPTAGQLVDARIRAAIAFSPSGGRDTSVADSSNRFADIRLPFLSLTGTLDTSVASKETAESRQWPFERMPGPDKYLLVLDGADHATFGGQSELRALRRSRPGNGDSDAANASIRAVSLMFWNAHLSGDDRAREWLTSGAFMQRLGPSDRWRVKR